MAQVFNRDNLARAWRWLLSNPDAAYKGYFRDHYASYNVASAQLLDDLRDRLKRGVFEPARSCKLFLPKPSGILRPLTLLTVEDQLVYQASVNVVADRLYPKVHARYFDQVFGHLYGGRTSAWFYRKWQSGYARFNAVTREAFNAGHRYVAHFDLTAFYDSVDHEVLSHFLKELKCDGDFVDFLTRCLNRWTSTRGAIFHGHGLPQGPLSSGLLGEVVLQHFDRNHRSPKTVRYLRYVDDIRLLATSETDLRRMITWLDFLSKEVGLFPQSNKIEIRKVTDIEEELKSISQPLEEMLDEDTGEVDQAALRRLIVELSPRHRVSDPTEFKFLLGRATPHSKLNARLWRILRHHPELYAQVLRYFQQYARFPRESERELLDALGVQPRYPSVLAEVIRTAEGRLSAAGAKRVDRFVKTTASPRSVPAADMVAALGRWGMTRQLLTASQIERKLKSTPYWWAQAQLVGALDHRVVTRAGRDRLLNYLLAEPVSDVAIAAAVQIERLRIRVTCPHSKIQHAAARVLEAFGVIPSKPGRVCGIERYVAKVLGSKPPAMNWRSFFGRDYSRVERQAVWCSALYDTNVTAWVNAMDVFDDWLLKALFRKDKTLGKYNLGQLGSILPCKALIKNYPATRALANELHDKRGESSLSHPVKKKAGVILKVAGRIRFGYRYRAKRFIQAAVTELAVQAAAKGW